MRATLVVSALLAILVLALSACGGGRAGSPITPPPPASGTLTQTAGDSGMPTPPPLFAPPPNPDELSSADAVASLPSEGIALFLQNPKNELLNNLPLTLSPLTESGDSITVRVLTTEELSLPEGLLALVRFNPQRLNPCGVRINEELFPEGRYIRFSLLQARGHTPVAVAAVKGNQMPSFPSGSELFRIHFAREPQPPSRQASKAPIGPSNKVELTMVLSSDRLRLQWAERHMGDYNLDGVVSIADITPLASHFNEAVGLDERKQVIDGNGDGVINIQDLTPLAAQYFTTLSGYDVETAFVAEGSSDEPVFARLPNEVFPDHPTVERSVPNPPTGWPIYYFSFFPDGFGTYYARVVPIGQDLTDRGTASDAASELFLDWPPEPPDSFGIQEQTRNSVTLRWSASSLDSDVTGLNIYQSQDAEATDLSAYTKLNTELIPPTPSSYTVSELAPNQTYYFVVSAVDEAQQESPVEQIMATRLQVDIIDAPPAPPPNFHAADNTYTSVILEWDDPAPEDDDIVGFNVYYTLDEGATTLAEYTKDNDTLIPPGAPHRYIVTDLTPNETYYFVISAQDEIGQDSLEADVLATRLEVEMVIHPVAVITVSQEKVYEDWAVTFSGEDSYSPASVALTTCTWNFGDGSGDFQVAWPGAVQHAFDEPLAAPGYHVTLTVEDDYGATGSTSIDLPVLPLTETRILLVWNTNSANDLEIKNYYASPYTGRGIPEDHILGLPLDADHEAISRDYYNSDIRDPIRTYIDDQPFARDSIYYIVTTKDVPLKVQSNGGSGYLNSYATVDSELCLLYETYDLQQHLDNPYYGHFSSGFPPTGKKGDPAKSQEWKPFQFSRDGVTMNYLVTRLTGWNVDDVKAMIDRSLNPYSGSEFYVILDDANKNYDMMNEPTADDSEDATSVLDRTLGGTHYYSDTDHQGDKITADFLQDPNISDHVIGYCSHGVHSGYPNEYILENLGFGYPNGALFMSYESFNGRTFRGGPYPHPGHGQVADFIAMGGTGGIGNVYEPYSDACGDESIIFAEYLNCDRNLAEALYKGLRRVSWVEVVVGDPLCKVNVTP